ncbi:MAG: replication initiator protein A [Clostridiales bacterium]|nr:replication initiator protein A [Clostridiales bacterium]
MGFDYFYKDQADSYAFYKIPRVLFTDGSFRQLSTDGKVLYGLLLDRISLSRENGWIDDEGRVYIYFTIANIMESLHCASEKACLLLAELQNTGLIEKKRQGWGRPTIIYVKDFTRLTKEVNSENPHIFDNRNSYDSKIEILDLRKSKGNKTNKSKTENNKTILSGEPVDNSLVELPDKDEDERREYLELLHDQLALDYLYEKYPYDRDIIGAIVDLILDVIFSKRKTIRIAGDDKPVKVVQSQFLKLNAFHIEYVLSCMKDNGTRIRNIKQYLLAAIYNAPLTMKSYFQARVNNDMAEGRL